MTLFSSLTISTIKGQTSQVEKIEFKVEREYWEGCETGKGEYEPLTFERNSEQDSALLIMPCGGTFTTVHLTKEGQKKPIKTLNIGNDECPPTFDLTELPDGKYGAYMMACGLGGPIEFTLITKKKLKQFIC